MRSKILSDKISKPTDYVQNLLLLNYLLYIKVYKLNKFDLNKSRTRIKCPKETKV